MSRGFLEPESSSAGEVCLRVRDSDVSCLRACQVQAIVHLDVSCLSWERLSSVGIAHSESNHSSAECGSATVTSMACLRLLQPCRLPLPSDALPMGHSEASQWPSSSLRRQDGVCGDRVGKEHEHTQGRSGCLESGRVGSVTLTGDLLCADKWPFHLR